MSSVGVDAILFHNHASLPPVTTPDVSEQLLVRDDEHFKNSIGLSYAGKVSRRTPRKSLIVVLPENHIVSPDMVSNRLTGEGDNELVDVILACAGPPLGISALQRRIRDLQILLAPAGTSQEDLRELAMSQAPGDIVTLMTGTPA